ncbi:MAG TPA: ergothioneine biosynthesis protein EgtB [Solirubrobacteraceae bacterium]|nr:ergothioneine biosynthesis protein EgtB [Solirubrobacteraceae bacterium]
MAPPPLMDALAEGRERTLALVAGLSDADVETQHTQLMSPLAWDLAHIAAYEELWLVHRYGGAPLSRPELAAMYDAFETPRAVRGDLPLLNRAEAMEYLADVRDRAPGGDDFVHELVLRHEMQHGETMLQAIELARLRPAPAVPRRVRPAAPGGHTGLEAVDIPGGACAIGARDGVFAYDNERPRHLTDVRGFRIGRTPITNATYLTFVEGGGYERRPWWRAEAWAWKEQYDITHPEGWARGPDGSWRRWTIEGWAPLDPDEPVVHLSWFEADAFARAHGARLPTEAEWEKAATWDQESGSARPYPWGDDPPDESRANLDHGLLGPAPAGAYPDGASASGVLGMLGDVWEWTASDFRGYDGFLAHPYREYSEVFFGDEYKVLRGGSWATRARVATPTFRNWDLPQRRQIFSGVRLAWDA